MKTNQKHTPTPWRIGSFGAIEGPKEGIGIPVDFIAKVEPLNGFGRYMDSEKAQSNAAFIVRSANNFERMLAALKEVHWLTQGPSMEKQDEVMIQVLEAIAKAEGK